MYLYGEDLDVLQRRAVDLRSQLADIVGTGSVVVDTAGATPSYLAMVDSMSAVSQGVEPLQVFMTGRIAGDGLEVPGVHHNPNQSPGQARGLWLGLTAETPFQNKMPPAADPLQRFGGLLVPGAKGLLPLESFFKLKLQDEHQAIDRENGVRKVVLYGSPDGSVALSHLLAAWQAIADNEKAPLRAEVGGDKAILGEMVGSFGFALVGGVLCVFVLLVILYENIWMPALVLISLPLAAIGGLLGLWATGERLAMGSMIGFVLLIGLSAKNAILLVDGINRFKVRLPIRQAVLMAVRGRVRPILMTSVALVIGMFPTVFLEGSGSEFRAPMALSIIAGMVTSTALSFFVIPALFGALSSFLRVHPRSSTVGQ
jgi:multidrug efflux pump subunit AcrB